ncbi:radical SAM/SPASM domain-containing protein [Bradyrhizobium sp. HKCCYLS3013]|uniref:radical SAM/SPASM domain-containing protein n=1 Tax=Bradyrhizobium sp. HKCCYLS3013 TaxID=3420735 RepID=UPI003EBBDF81
MSALPGRKRAAAPTSVKVSSCPWEQLDMHSRDRVTKPTELVFNISYRCPLKCSHCCFSSDMTQLDVLPQDLMIAAIDDAAVAHDMTRINLVGGDPFLQPELMRAAASRARSFGLSTSATTSAYWATSEAKAERILTPLVEAGLERIIISFDDMHAEFLDGRNIAHAYRAARSLGLDVLIAVVTSPGSVIDRSRIFDLLGVDPDSDPQLSVYETAINSTGRAVDDVSASDLDARRHSPQVYRGPCPSVLRHFSVAPSGNVLPCCGVLPFHAAMSVGDLNETPMSEAMSRAYMDPVWKWIAFEGPIALLCEITAETERPLAASDFDGICTACDRLFSNPKLLQLLDSHLPRKLPTLTLLEHIFEAVGVFHSVPPPSSDLSAKF